MKKYTVFFWILLLFIFVVKLIYIGWGPLDLAPDEAHYWDWSRNLDICYYSKGPFIAYTIFLGAKIGSLLSINPPNPAFWVRFPAVVNSTLLGIAAWFLSISVWKDKRAAFLTILILTAIPIYAVGSILMTIDNPLMLFWALYIFTVFKALETGRNKYWYFSGIILGLGFLSKYTIIILIPCVSLYLLASEKHRFRLKQKGFYLGLVIAVLFFMPVLIWNVKHNWVGLRHLAGQAGLSKNGPFFSVTTFEFAGIQFGAISPIIFILIIAAFIKAWKLRADYRYSFLFWTGIPLGIFYLILSLHEYCQANWPAPLYFSGSIIAGNLFSGRRILKLGILLGVVMWLTVFCIDLLPDIPSKWDPTIRLRGWKKLGEEIGKIKYRFSKKKPLFILSDTYQLTSELAFYTPGQPRTYCVNLGRRMNQYDIWGGIDKMIGQNALYVKHRDQTMDKELISSFKTWEKLPLIDIRENKGLIYQFSVFLCKEFKGLKKAGHEINY